MSQKIIYLRLTEYMTHQGRNMARTVNITVSKTRLDWTDFTVVGEDDIADGDAKAGATIDYSWSQRGSNLNVNITVTHFAEVESDTVHTAALLRHEQGHLDLGILVARRMKRDIVGGMSADNASALHMPRLDTINSAYDDATEHSQNVANQERWNAALRQALGQRTPPEAILSEFL
jgi:hypothetical protein